jgi:hypothetical protein
MTAGELWMPLWFVDRPDIPVLVPLLELVHSMDKAEDQSSWMMSAAMELNKASLTVQPQLLATVCTVKMLESPVFQLFAA